MLLTAPDSGKELGKLDGERPVMVRLGSPKQAAGKLEWPLALPPSGARSLPSRGGGYLKRQERLRCQSQDSMTGKHVDHSLRQTVADLKRRGDRKTKKWVCKLKNEKGDFERDLRDFGSDSIRWSRCSRDIHFCHDYRQKLLLKLLSTWTYSSPYTQDLYFSHLLQVPPQASMRVP